MLSIVKASYLCPMRLWLSTILVLSSILYSCSPNDFVGDELIDGDITAGLYGESDVVYGNLSQDIVIEGDSLSNDTAAIDVDFDGTNDLSFYSIKAEDDSISFIGTYIDGNIQIAYEGSEQLQITSFDVGDKITRSQLDWITPENFPLSAQTIDSEGIDIYGNLNGRTSFIAFSISTNNVEAIGWINISIANHNKLTIHDFAVKVL